MAIDFPNSPSTNDQYTVGTTTWMYNGTAWVVSLGDASIATGAITADKIASNAVTTAKILDANVTAGKIASGAAVSNIGYTPANIASPTFTGTVVLPSTTSIGTVSATEIGYVDGVTSAIQTQLDSKLTATTASTSNRNKIINGAMNVWQRGTSFTAASTYTTDRFTVDNGTVTRQTGTGQFPYCVRIANTSINPAIRQAIELPANGNPGLFTNGSTWTISFYAKTSTTVTSNLSLYIAFGDTLYSGFTQILSDTSLPVPTTSWVRYSKTFTVGVSPAGSNPLMAVVIYLNNGAYAGNFEITGIQLEAGAVATPFEFEDYGTTLAKCQRYFCSIPVASADAYAAAGAPVVGRVFYPVRMRALPTLTTGTQIAQGNNTGAFTFDAATSSELSGTLVIYASASARAYYYAALTASIEL